VVFFDFTCDPHNSIRIKGKSFLLSRGPKVLRMAKLFYTDRHFFDPLSRRRQIVSMCFESILNRDNPFLLSTLLFQTGAFFYRREKWHHPLVPFPPHVQPSTQGPGALLKKQAPPVDRSSPKLPLFTLLRWSAPLQVMDLLRNVTPRAALSWLTARAHHSSLIATLVKRYGPGQC